VSGPSVKEQNESPGPIRAVTSSISFPDDGLERLWRGCEPSHGFGGQVRIVWITMDGIFLEEGRHVEEHDVLSYEIPGTGTTTWNEKDGRDAQSKEWPNSGRRVSLLRIEKGNARWPQIKLVKGAIKEVSLFKAKKTQWSEEHRHRASIL
jgi:hypothetical protein